MLSGSRLIRCCAGGGTCCAVTICRGRIRILLAALGRLVRRPGLGAVLGRRGTALMLLAAAAGVVENKDVVILFVLLVLVFFVVVLRDELAARAAGCRGGRSVSGGLALLRTSRGSRCRCLIGRRPRATIFARLLAQPLAAASRNLPAFLRGW